MRIKRYIATVADAEGLISQYVFTARTRRGARSQAREWVKRTDWGATFVRIERVIDAEVGARGLRLLHVAGLTLIASGTTISAMMIIGLRIEGAL